MPIPWVAAAKAIPWTEVIAAAPGLARSARGLWNKVRNEAPEIPGEDGAEAPPPLDMRVATLEHALAELGREAQARSELIAQLAEQNEQLVTALDTTRRQLRLALALAAIAVIGMLVLFVR